MCSRPKIYLQMVCIKLKKPSIWRDLNGAIMKLLARDEKREGVAKSIPEGEGV